MINEYSTKLEQLAHISGLGQALESLTKNIDVIKTLFRDFPLEDEHDGYIVGTVTAGLYTTEAILSGLVEFAGKQVKWFNDDLGELHDEMVAAAENGNLAEALGCDEIEGDEVLEGVSTGLDESDDLDEQEGDIDGNCETCPDTSCVDNPRYVSPIQNEL